MAAAEKPKTEVVPHITVVPVAATTIPIRDLWLIWHCAKSTAKRVRTSDPDYLANVTEFDVGGVKQITTEHNERFLAAKLARAKAEAKPAGPIKRKPGRPRTIGVRPVAAQAAE